MFHQLQIKVKSRAQNIKAQKLLIKLGYSWYGGDKDRINEADYVFNAAALVADIKTREIMYAKTFWEEDDNREGYIPTKYYTYTIKEIEDNLSFHSMVFEWSKKVRMHHRTNFSIIEIHRLEKYLSIAHYKLTYEKLFKLCDKINNTEQKRVHIEMHCLSTLKLDREKGKVIFGWIEIPFKKLNELAEIITVDYFTPELEVKV